MAATVYTGIRLDTDLTGDLPTNTYRVNWEGKEKVFEPAVLVERGLTGDLIVHRTQSAGEPIVFDNYRYTLTLTRAEVDQLAADLGRLVYFMPHYRDEGDVATYRRIMFFRSMTGVENFDPKLEWWKATIELVSAEGHTEVD